MVKLVGYAQAKNELRKGHLIRFLENFSRVTDEFVIYDDGSDDGSQEVYKQYTRHVIQGPGNEFRHEAKMSQACLDYCRDVLCGDWAIWTDVDCIFNRAATDESALRKLIDRAENGLPQLDGWTFHYINTYLNPWWKRLDNQFNDLLSIGMFRLTPELRYDLTPGVHRPRSPQGIELVDDQNEVEIIHLGFASIEDIERKYRQYKPHQSGWMLDRLIHTEGMELEKLPADIFPNHWMPKPCDEKPYHDFTYLREE